MKVLFLDTETTGRGNKEAVLWLRGKRTSEPYNYTKYLKTEVAKELGRAIYDEAPSSWWNALYTNQRKA